MVFVACAHRFGYVGPSVRVLPVVQVGPHGRGRLYRSVPMPRPGSGCERPVSLGCQLCGLVVAVDCHATRTLTCGPCGELYRDRVRRVARRFEARLVLVTLTAPGHPRHRRQDALTGQWSDCGCASGMGEAGALARWNASLGKRWNRFLDHGVKRAPGMAWLVAGSNDKGEAAVSYLKAVEPQQRGALHVHALVQVPADFVLPGCWRVASVNGCQVARCFDCAAVRAADPRVIALGKLAESYGFGHVSDVQVVQGHRAAGYVAKYVAKGSNARPDVPWQREHSEAPPRYRHEQEVRRAGLGSIRGRATYRTWTASRSWPLTMVALRDAQQHYASLVSVLPAWEGLAPGPELADLGPVRPAPRRRRRPVRTAGPHGGPVDVLAPADAAVARVLVARAGLSLPRALAVVESLLGPVQGVTPWEARCAARDVAGLVHATPKYRQRIRRQGRLDNVAVST